MVVMTYQIEKGGTKKAAKKLGLRYPVRVRITDDLDGMAGKYHGLGRWGFTSDAPLDKIAHHISINANIDSNTANTAIWHEMTHAKQCERFLPADVSDQDERARIANRTLALEFRWQMKDIRIAKGIKSTALTTDYANVSFEVEARESDKMFAKKINIIKADKNQPKKSVRPLPKYAKYDYDYYAPFAGDKVAERASYGYEYNWIDEIGKVAISEPELKPEPDNFFMDSDQDNDAVIEVMDESISWYEDQLQELKDKLAISLRESVAELQDSGVEVNCKVKDRMYTDLVNEEIIEQWEPLLF